MALVCLQDVLNDWNSYPNHSVNRLLHSGTTYALWPPRLHDHFVFTDNLFWPEQKRSLKQLNAARFFGPLVTGLHGVPLNIIPIDFTFENHRHV